MTNKENIKTIDIPEVLKEIPSPPSKLFLRGKMPDEKFIKLCVVGARKYSPYGKEVCKKLISGLSGYPITIVSGLAIGIDSIAHESALQANLPTIAIPGSGISDKVLYPKSNLHLAKRILENGGAILSEFEPEEKAATWTFPKRNRIMAGISKAVLVIEAERASGTLITARLALDYGRDILTVPGSIFSSNSTGPHYLLSQGAGLIQNSEDILEALGIKSEKKEKNFEHLSEDEQIIIHALDNPKSREELLEETGFDISKLSSTITLLEIKGLVKESVGEIMRI